MSSTTIQLDKELVESLKKNKDKSNQRNKKKAEEMAEIEESDALRSAQGQVVFGC